MCWVQKERQQNIWASINEEDVSKRVTPQKRRFPAVSFNVFSFLSVAFFATCLHVAIFGSYFWIRYYIFHIRFKCHGNIVMMMPRMYMCYVCWMYICKCVRRVAWIRYSDTWTLVCTVAQCKSSRKFWRQFLFNKQSFDEWNFQLFAESTMVYRSKALVSVLSFLFFVVCFYLNNELDVYRNVPPGFFFYLRFKSY